MDGGISIAASIVGLLGAAATVSLTLNNFVESVKTIPQLAKSVLLEVSDVSACLCQLQRIVLGAELGSGSQDKLIMVDQLVVVLSNCVMIFSKLEETLEPLNLDNSKHLSKIARWMLQQQSIHRLLMRLQASKLSLTLVLTTLTCTSIGEAQTAVGELKALIAQVLENNEDLVQRMAGLESQISAITESNVLTSRRESEAASNSAIAKLRPKTPVLGNDETSMTFINPASDDIKDDQDKESFMTTGPVNPPTIESLTNAFSSAFDQVLFASRPYSRAMNRRPCLSETSSIVPSMDWSYFSGLSLAEVSDVSILSLPISPQEFWNGKHYSAMPKHPDASDERMMQLNGAASTNRITQLSLPPQIMSVQNNYLKRWTVDEFLETIPEVHDKSAESKKIIFLGTPSSGKSTVVTHLRLLHEDNYTTSDRVEVCRQIVKDLIFVFTEVYVRSRYRLAMRHDYAGIDLQGYALSLQASPEFRLSQSMVRELQGLWAIPLVRGETKDLSRSLLSRSRLSQSVCDNIPYFMENLDCLLPSDDLIPDEMFLRAKRFFAETGPLRLHGESFYLIDDGGRGLPAERWIHRFRNADTLVFVVSLPGICHERTNSEALIMMRDSLRFFEKMTKLSIFDDVRILILLNKLDIFKQTIVEKPISAQFTESNGGSDCFTACQFFADEFVKCDRRNSGGGGVLQIQPTSAVDQTLFEKTSEAIMFYGEAGQFEGSTNWDTMDPKGKRKRKPYMNLSRAAVPNMGVETSQALP